MPEEKKEAIIIPRLEKILTKKIGIQRKNNSYLLLFAIGFFYAGLFVLISYLPISQSFRILGLSIGSFLLLDILHFLKRLWLQN